MNIDLYILDFQDSFTYNIFSVLKETNPTLRIKVIPYKEILSLCRSLKSTKRKFGLILGPGPGHPDEYLEVESYISTFLAMKNVYLMGICLGHQIIAKALGHNIKSSIKPVHGQTQTYNLNCDFSRFLDGVGTITVQRYNSLSAYYTKPDSRLENELKIKYLKEGEEIIMIKGERLLTYQFHPESVGTTCPKKYFQHIVNFLI